MMKLLLENWKRYTTSLLNEDLIVESLEQAEASVIKRASKLIKGWAYSNNKSAYDFIEEKSKDVSPQEDFFSSWEIGGYFVYRIVAKNIPGDIEESEKKVALLWNYRQFIEGKLKPVDPILETILKYIIKKYKSKSKIPFTSISRNKLQQDILNMVGVKAFIGIVLYDKVYPFRENYKLIENFFHWNRFIRNGKRDLNSVENYDELFELVEEARPLYQAWQEKLKYSNPEKGKEELLNNNEWHIIAVHNKGAACELGKGTDWCTAAPGLNYFQSYYKENDPLFYILDKKTNKKYQFNFGHKQFMNKDDKNIASLEPNVFKEIMKVLATVVPDKYDIATKALKKYKSTNKEN